MLTNKLLDNQRELEDAFLMEFSTEDVRTNREVANLYNYLRDRHKRIVRLCKRINKIS